jgi:hypothetical protein
MLAVDEECEESTIKDEEGGETAEETNTEERKSETGEEE